MALSPAPAFGNSRELPHHRWCFEAWPPETPLTGKASIVYTDDTFNSWMDNGTTFQLPEIVLAQEN
jgi:hypothetical protein